MDELQQTVIEWADGAHPGRTPEGTMLKLFEEIGEIVASPRDSSEYADVLIVLVDLAFQNGISGAEMMKQAHAKMDINKSRNWSINSLGIMSHE